MYYFNELSSFLKKKKEKKRNIITSNNNLDEFGFQQSNGFKTVSIFEKFTFGQMSYKVNAIFKNKEKLSRPQHVHPRHENNP